MKHMLLFAVGLLFVVLPEVGGAIPDKGETAKPADGIYQIIEKGAGPKITRNDTGDHLVLGERLATNFGTATIFATNNSNTRFRIDLVGAGPLAKAPVGASAALVIGGRCFMIHSYSDREANGTQNLGSVIHGEEAVQAVAGALKVKPILRKHPGHQFLVTFEPEKPSYRPSEPITLIMKIKNIGAGTVSFHDGGRQRGPRDNQFGFTAMRGHGFGKAVPDTGDPTNFGGLGSDRVLKPGDVFQKKVSLEKWFQLQDADTYLISGTYRLEFTDPNSRTYRVTWDDFATAECNVRIDARK